jgi:hypothetical protein
MLTPTIITNVYYKYVMNTHDRQRPIPFLSVSTLPGTKVLIGGVVCAAGALLLNDTNCFLLGGSIPATDGAPSSTRPSPSLAMGRLPTNHHHNGSSSSSSNRASDIPASHNDNRAAPLGQPPHQTKPSAVEMEFDELEIDDLAWEAMMAAPPATKSLDSTAATSSNMRALSSHNSTSTSSSTSAVRSRGPPAVSKASSGGAGPNAVVDLTEGEGGGPFLPPPLSIPQPPAKPLMTASGNSTLPQRSVSPPRLFPQYLPSTSNLPTAPAMRAPLNSNYISPVNVKAGGSGYLASDSVIVSSLPSSGSGSGSGSVAGIVPSPWTVLSDLTEGTQRVHGLVVDTAGKLRVTDNQYVVNLVVMDSSGVSIACRVCPEYALRYLFDGMACQDYEAMEKSRKKKLNAYLARKIASIEGVMDLECRRVNRDHAGGSSLQAILKSHRQPRFDEIKQYTDHVKSLYMCSNDHPR